MASGKVVAILRKKGLSEDQILSMSDGEAWGLVYQSRPPKKEGNLAKEICFTGFSEAKERHLKTLAEEAGLGVKSSVTKKLAYLCVGDYPGPKKLEDAKLRGADIVTEAQFLSLLNTGDS